jgi:hypothetical protein
MMARIVAVSALLLAALIVAVMAAWQARATMTLTGTGSGDGGVCGTTPYVVAPDAAAAASGSASAGTTAFAVPSGATVVYAVNGPANQTFMAVSDSAGNSYTPIQAAAAAGVLQAALFYKTNVAAMPRGTSFTATLSGGSSFTYLQKGAWVTCTTGSLDFNQTLNQTTANTGITLTGTTTVANDLLFAYAYPGGGGGTITTGTGFTSVYDGSFNDIAYLIKATAGSVSYNPTWTSSSVSSSILLALQPTAAGAYTPQGVNFGSTAYSNKLSALSGASGSIGLVSFWINNTNAAGSGARLILCVCTSANAYRVNFGLTNSGEVVIGGYNSSSTQLLSLTSANVYTSMGTTWKHVIASWNLSTGRCQMYSNFTSSSSEASDTGGSTGSDPTVCTSGTIDYAGANQPTFAASAAAANYLAANISDVQFWTGVDVDISNATNRGYFFNSGNALNPTTASAHFGNPCILMTGSTISTWATNPSPATCGTFTQSSGVTAAPTNPP